MSKLITLQDKNFRGVIFRKYCYVPCSLSQQKLIPLTNRPEESKPEAHKVVFTSRTQKKRHCGKRKEVGRVFFLNWIGKWKNKLGNKVEPASGTFGSPELALYWQIRKTSLWTRGKGAGRKEGCRGGGGCVVITWLILGPLAVCSCHLEPYCRLVRKKVIVGFGFYSTYLWNRWEKLLPLFKKCIVSA